MNVRVCFLLILLSISVSCAEGIRKSTWSKREVLEWYLKYAPTNDRIRDFGYCGSDAQYHYFVTRPIDSTLRIRVPRTELALSDERPHASLGDAYYFYRVDPSHDFDKVTNGATPKA